MRESQRKQTDDFDRAFWVDGMSCLPYMDFLC